jgi:hypothetical protein
MPLVLNKEMKFIMAKQFLCAACYSPARLRRRTGELYRVVCTNEHCGQYQREAEFLAQQKWGKNGSP